MKIFFSSLSILFIVVLNVNNAGKVPSKDQSLQIIDGSEVKPHSIPYMVAVRSNIDGRSILCGGSLLTISLVLTAASCVYGASEAEVILGAHNLDQDETSQNVMRSADFIIHERYTNESRAHDIALISLPSTVPLSTRVSLVELPTFADYFNLYDGKAALVAGWGRTNDTESTMSTVLRAVNLTIIPVLNCEISHALQITFEQMCASGEPAKKNICLGDAGSPLVVNGVQVGIASYGSDFGCGIGFPGVYTRITSYLAWLGKGME